MKKHVKIESFNANRDLEGILNNDTYHVRFKGISGITFIDKENDIKYTIISNIELVIIDWGESCNPVQNGLNEILKHAYLRYPNINLVYSDKAKEDEEFSNLTPSFDITDVFDDINLFDEVKELKNFYISKK